LVDSFHKNWLEQRDLCIAHSVLIMWTKNYFKFLHLPRLIEYLGYSYSLKHDDSKYEFSDDSFLRCHKFRWRGYESSNSIIYLEETTLQFRKDT
jgi:ferric iron reductase protein FhuF